MKTTLEQKRDRFKEHIRPILRQRWYATCRNCDIAGTSDELRMFRDLFLAVMQPLLLPLMVLCGYDARDAVKAASDAESVINELFDEIATSETLN